MNALKTRMKNWKSDWNLMEQKEKDLYLQCESELAAMQARIEKLEAGIKLAQSKLRSTQINWQEDCLFDCDDILTNALAVDK